MAKKELMLIDRSKILITPTYLKIKEKITEEEYMQVWVYFGNINNKLMVYIGDLANQEGMVGKQGQVSTGFYNKVQEKTGLKYGTIKTAKMIMGNIQRCNRLYLCGIKHYALVYQMESKQQKYWLEKCINEGWSTRIFGQKIFSSIPPPPLPKGEYSIIYADPPWEYRNTGFDMSSDKQYKTMEIEEIKNLTDLKGKTVQEIIAKNAVLFLWVTNPLLKEGIEVVEAWGFEYKTNFAWVKGGHTAGFYIYGEHELLLIGIKGSFLPTGELSGSVLDCERSKRHSEKPKIVYEVIETMYPNQKYVELFARNKRKGWRSWGNELYKENRNIKKK